MRVKIRARWVVEIFLWYYFVKLTISDVFLCFFLVSFLTVSALEDVGQLNNTYIIFSSGLKLKYVLIINNKYSIL